jgi:LuxR family transcriptional regulator, maltose regulon positive regulatory protein
VLATKLNVPGPRPGFVPRPRLAQRLDVGLGQGLVLVCAPAGYGKTVLLADRARRGRHPVAWLSLDAGDNDPPRFWRHAAVALERARPGIGGRVSPLRVRRRARARIAGIPAGAPAAGPASGASQPQRSAAAAGPAALHRQRSGGPAAAGGRRSRRCPARRSRRGAGGPDRGVGGRAAARRPVLRAQSDVTGFVAAFTGSNRYVLDYLADEVLARQTGQARAFLLETSVLERLTGALCDAVTGRPGSQALLEQVERAGLFLMPLMRYAAGGATTTCSPTCSAPACRPNSQPRRRSCTATRPPGTKNTA